MMELDHFLEDLLSRGEVTVAPGPPPRIGREACRLLEKADTLRRLELAGSPPAFCLPAATWALRLFYQACQFLVCRELGAELVRQELARPCPRFPDRSPADVVYSVDLIFQCLPDLFRLARNTSAGDPLVDSLRRLGREWPLSSVGLSLTSDTTPTQVREELDLDSFIEHESLRQLYVDRILSRGDSTRVHDPRVSEAIRECRGGHPELVPEGILS